MTKFRGFNNSVISVPKRKLNRTQTKQVQKIIQANKRIKNYYVPIDFEFTNETGATQLFTNFQELTSVGINGPDASVRQTSEIQLQSYNIKLGLVPYTNDVAMAVPSQVNAPYRVIIARSKQGPVTDIVDNAGAIVSFTQQPDPDIFQVYHDEIHTPASATGGNELGYLMHMYKSFKNKKVPHMIVGYNDTTATPDATGANNNPIYMKILVDTSFASPSGGGAIFNFQIRGFAHMKFFDKE